MALTHNKIVELYTATFNRAADADGVAYWETQTHLDQVQMANAFIISDEASALYPDSLSKEDYISEIYSNLFGRAAADDEVAYWAGEDIARDSMVVAIVNGALDGDKTILDNKTAVSNYHVEQGLNDTDFSLDSIDKTEASVTAALADIDALTVSEEVAGNEYYLTSGTDRGADFVGTDDKDTFIANIEQNSFTGGVSNSLSSADHLDGGAGTDTLNAELVQEFIGANSGNNNDIQAHTISIETVTFNAIDDNMTTTVDAKNMLGVSSIGSSFSDGDLVIENLTTLNNDGTTARNTDALTITMDHTDNFNSDRDASDLTVYFDEDYLLNGQVEGTTSILYAVMNQDAYDLINDGKEGVELLDSVTVAKLNFVLDGKTYEITPELLGEADDTTGTVIRTHDELATAINAALVTMGLNDKVTAAVNGTFTEKNADGTFGSRTAPIVELKGVAGVELSASENLIYLAPSETEATSTDGTAIRNSNRYDRSGEDNEAASNLPISVNIELNKAGRDGEGGNLTVGGKNLDSDGDTDVDQKDGIEVFNVTVSGNEDRPSNLGQIVSTNAALKTVNITSEANADDEATYASLSVTGDTGGSNYANTSSTAAFGGDLTTLNANSFKGNLLIGQKVAAQNIDTFTATGGGDVTLKENIDANGAFTVTTGAGKDSITVTLSGNSVDATGESLNITTGSGKDTVTLNMSDGVSYETMAILDNLNISTGGGDDKVLLNNYGTFDIITGDGSDFVEIDADTSDDATGSSGNVYIGNYTGPQTFADRVLYDAELVVAFAGFESKVDIPTTSGKNFVADQIMINEAIKEAIKASPELSQLLKTSDNPGDQQMKISSLVDGNNNIDIAIYQPQLVANIDDLAKDSGQTHIKSSDVSSLRQGLLSTETVDGASDSLEDADEIANWTAGNNEWYGSVSSTGTADEHKYSDALLSHDTAEDQHDDNEDILDHSANYLSNADLGTIDTSDVRNFSTVDLGDGSNDLVVLDSNLGSVNTIVVSQSFGKVSVVNFFNDLAVRDVENSDEVGNHAVDFSTYLNDQDDASTTGDVKNSDSALNILTTVNMVNGAEGFTTQSHDATNTNDAVANGINVLRFDSSAVEDDTFEDLNASTLVKALNDTEATTATNYGNLTGDLLTPIYHGDTLVDKTQSHIIMVENDLNEGEYKVFSLTSTWDKVEDETKVQGDSTGSENQFDTTAVELGTMDFGASINLLAAGSQEFKDVLKAAIESSDEDGAGTGGVTPPVEDDTIVELVADTTGEDGVVENFTYAIDSSTGNVISGLDIDITLSGFTVGEDSLTFTDVTNGTVTTEAFISEIETSGSGIYNLTDVYFDQNADGFAQMLTIAGIVDPDLSTMDMTVA